MHRFALVFVTLLTITGTQTALAGTPIAERDPAIGLEGSGSPGGGASGACTIAYYNYCSGWLWLYTGFIADDQVGIVYDLAENCSGGEGHTCTNIANWWYWRFTQNGYCAGGAAFGVNFNLFELGTDGCLEPNPVGSTAYNCPLERWNYVPGLGTATSDRIALVASWRIYGGTPHLATDNNVYNASGGPACAGVGPGDGTSYRFRFGGVNLCPPTVLEDALGPVNIIAFSLWNCTSPTATEASSWSDLKQLFQ